MLEPAEIERTRERLQQIGCHPSQIADAMSRPDLAIAWLDLAESATSIQSKAAFVSSKIRNGQHPDREQSAGTRIRASTNLAQAPVDNDAPYPYSEREAVTWKHQHRLRCIAKGADPRKFWGGPRAEELETWRLRNRPKEQEEDAIVF